jgi:hypothetical protein
MASPFSYAWAESEPYKPNEIRADWSLISFESIPLPPLKGFAPRPKVETILKIRIRDSNRFGRIGTL